MSRSGGTKETIDFFNATKERFKTRIVAANKGKLREIADELNTQQDSKVLIIDDTRGDIGGRQMNRKTLMVFAPLYLALRAGLKDENSARDSLRNYCEALFEANEELAYTNGLNSQAVRLAEFLFRHRQNGRIKFSVIFDESLKFTAKELFQLLNEGANKNIAGGTNNNILGSYSLTNDEKRYRKVFAADPDSQLPIFLLNKNSPDYKKALDYIAELEEKGIPYIVITAELKEADLAHNLKTLARMSALCQDMVVYFTYITNQDANSNPAVKFVREITAAMFEILKEKKQRGEKDLRITFADVIGKIKEQRENAKEKAKSMLDEKNVIRENYKSVFDPFKDAIKNLAGQLNVAEEEVTLTLLGSISESVLKTDVGEAGGCKTAVVEEAFSRSRITPYLGKYTPDPQIVPLEKQIILYDDGKIRISVAVERDGSLRFDSKNVAENLAKYIHEMYKKRKESLKYITLTFMEVDSDNPLLRDIVTKLTDTFAKKKISPLLLGLPGVAHTGIEAVMSHPESIFNIGIIYTDTYGGELGAQKIDEYTTIDEATYVYGISNVIRMALGGTPSIIFEVENSKDLEYVKNTIYKTLSILQQKGF
jgi:hypothetical protein